jgi:osmotically-inducible protein OsmY
MSGSQSSSSPSSASPSTSGSQGSVSDQSSGAAQSSSGSQAGASQSSAVPQSDMGAGSGNDVQTKIQSAIKQDSSLSDANVNVSVTGKTVELTGTAPNAKARKEAKKIAKENANGMKVVDHIQVSGQNSAKP